jgi:hypothetical protein
MHPTYGAGGTYPSGPQGSAVPLTKEQRMAKAIHDLRQAISPWGDGDHARIIRAILDKHDV